MPYKPYNFHRLKTELERDEGVQFRMYEDSLGIATIGIGFNLEANQISKTVVDQLFQESVDVAEEALDRIEPSWRNLSPVRQRALLNMSFNLGQTRLASFKKMWNAIRKSDFKEAGKEIQNSRYYGQVGARAKRVKVAVETGD